jgi:hypothetical protein
MTTLRYGATFCCRPLPDRMKKGVMIKFLPWDIWAAMALAITVGLAAIFDPAPAVFIVVYLGLCAYIVVGTVNGEPR